MSHRALGGQFHQPRMFDPGPATASAPSEEAPEPPLDGKADYHARGGSINEGLGWTHPNPLHDPEVTHVEPDRFKQPSEEYVPTWKIGSNQPKVNPNAIDHLTQHADLMNIKEPIYLIRNDKGHQIYNGNHRVNAAQKQGRLFVPAQVFDPRPPRR